MTEWSAIVNAAADLSSGLDVLDISAVGLRVRLLARERALLDWVPTYLDPLLDDEDAATHHERSVTIACLYSDKLLSRIVDCARANPHSTTEPGYLRVPLRKLRVDEGITFCVEPQQGVAWISNSATSRIWLIYSARTCWPALEFSRLTRELFTLHLESRGWTQCHAAAAATERGTVLIAGPRRAGKTTLLLALMSQRAGCIANDRTFLRNSAAGLEVLAYPMCVAVGLGTALQFSALEPYILSPDTLAFPRRRLNIEAIRAERRSEWGNLPDKIDFLPSELELLLRSGKRRRAGTVGALVVPDVSHEPCVPCAHEHADATQVILAHANRDPDYPAWLDMGWTAPSGAQRVTFPRKAFRLAFSVCSQSPGANARILEQVNELLV